MSQAALQQSHPPFLRLTFKAFVLRKEGSPDIRYRPAVCCCYCHTNSKSQPLTFQGALVCVRPCTEIWTICLSGNSRQTSAVGYVMIPTLQMKELQ